MKIYYCVTSSYDDRGRVTAAVTSTRIADKKPKNEYHSIRNKDIYIDWFDSMNEAQKYADECRVC